MEKTHIAVLFERMIVNDNVYFFKPINLLEGEYLQEGIFIDQYGNSYYDLLESHVGMCESDEYFGFPTPMKKYKEEKNKFEYTRLFLDEINNYVYFGILNDNTGELELIRIPISSIKKHQTQVENAEEETIDDSETKIYFPAETLQKLIGIEDINEIKKFFKQILETTGLIEDGITNKKEVEMPLSKPSEATKDVLKQPKEKKMVEGNDDKLPFDIKAVYDYVTSKVINQDEAVKKIVLNFALNYLAITKGNIEDFKPTRCLITGPTGTGKSLIIETMIEYLEKNNLAKIPIVKAPTSQLTVAGYVGTDLEDLLEELVSKTPIEFTMEERIKYAEKHGVIFFDEIDKKGSPSNGDVSGRGVLNSLLQFLDGTRYTIEMHKTRYYFNTKYLNIFASGAFTHVEDELKKGIIGFGANPSGNTSKGATVEDYIKKGNMPNEFMGRFPQLVKLNPLGVEELKRILKYSKASPLLVEQAKLALAGVKFNWDETYIEEVAKKAYNLKLGARSLQTIIEESLFDMSWDTLTSNGDKIIKVTKDNVDQTKQYKKI